MDWVCLSVRIERKTVNLTESDRDRRLLELLLAACRCACSVYKPDIHPGGDLVPVISRTPSITGTVKATSIWKAEDTNTLFVSIRGTSCKTDHLVNFNKNQKDAASVFVSLGNLEIFQTLTVIFRRSQVLKSKSLPIVASWLVQQLCFPGSPKR
jgi:hypothetical protein